MMLEVTLGITDMAVVSSDFDRNFLPGLSTQVFTPKPVNMPDWTGNIGTPAPFDFGVTFDTPFAYLAALPLVIDFTYSNLAYTSGTATGGSAVDRQFGSDSSASGSTVGTGCVATGQTATFLHNAWLENSGATLPNHGMRLRVDGLRGPASSPALVYVDVVDANTNFPGLCGTVHALPTIVLDAGVTDASGDLPNTFYSFAYDPANIGVTLYTQMIAFDAGQSPFPVVLSNAETMSMPAFSGATPGVETLYHWSALPEDLNNLVFFGGGMVLELRL